MDNSLMKAALWRFIHRKRDWRRVAAWTLVVCMTVITASYVAGAYKVEPEVSSLNSPP